MLVPGFGAAQSPPVGDDLRMATTDQMAVKAPFAGVVVALSGEPGERIAAGAPVAILEAMKMEHEVLAETGGVVAELAVAIGDAVEEGQLLVRLEPGAAEAAPAPANGDEPAGRPPEASAPTCVPFESATRSASTPRAPTPSRAATSTGAARRARTSMTSSTRAASSSTDRCCSRPRSSGAAARS